MREEYGVVPLGRENRFIQKEEDSDAEDHYEYRSVAPIIER